MLDTTLSFAAPYVAFLPAEEIHASGVLAVVVAGLVLGHNAPVLQSAGSRIAENINWRTVQFLLENVVFLLIGLQIRRSDRRRRGRAPAVDAGRRALPARAGRDDPGPRSLDVRRAPGRCGCCASRSGPGGSRRRVLGGHARGGHAGGGVPAARPEPERDLLALAAFTVVAGTLLIQGLTLPVARPPAEPARPRPAEDALQRAGLVTDAGRAGLAVLDEVRSREDPPEVHRPVARPRDAAAATSSGNSSAARSPSSSRRPPPTTDCGCRCWPPSAAPSSQARDRGVYDDEVLRAALPRDRPRGVDARPDRGRRRAGRRRADHADHARRGLRRTCGTRRAMSQPARPQAARSACGTGRGGCTCGCA